MSDSCQVETEVIAIDDDDEDEEGVEVVFSNISKTHVYRNLIYNKISQEIQLLQAMCNKTVPNEFDQFRELAQKLGFQFGDDVIRSAWQRIRKKYLVKLNSHQNSKPPICLVSPLLSPVGMSPPRADPPPSSHHSPSLIVTTPSTSPPVASVVFPIALLKNQSIDVDNSHNSRTECLTKRPKLISSPETHAYDENGHTTCYGANKQHTTVPESEYSKIDNVCDGNYKVSNGQKSCEKNQRKKNNLSTVTDKQGCCVGLEQNQLSGRKKVTRKSSEGRKSFSKQVVSVGSQKTIEQEVEQSHVGVKAKIVRTKQTSPTSSRKRLKEPIKVITEAELKEFKAEQKILKLKQKKEFEMQQLQKVHDRLVDVLIPKYYNN